MIKPDEDLKKHNNTDTILVLLNSVLLFQVLLCYSLKFRN